VRTQASCAPTSGQWPGRSSHRWCSRGPPSRLRGLGGGLNRAGPHPGRDRRDPAAVAGRDVTHHEIRSRPGALADPFWIAWLFILRDRRRGVLRSSCGARIGGLGAHRPQPSPRRDRRGLRVPPSWAAMIAGRLILSNRGGVWPPVPDVPTPLHRPGGDRRDAHMGWHERGHARAGLFLGGMGASAF